ncbi:MAG: hypothetical protein ABR962_00075 [Candidatus Bathyarchaeia archaeon]|jgi:hypothetical protein
MAERKAKAKEHADKKLKLIPSSRPTSRYVATDYDDDIKRFAESEEESVEIPNPNDKMLSNLRSRVIALKKTKKVENVKVVSRTKKGKLTELWLVKK